MQTDPIASLILSSGPMKLFCGVCAKLAELSLNLDGGRQLGANSPSNALLAWFSITTTSNPPLTYATLAFFQNVIRIQTSAPLLFHISIQISPAAARIRGMFPSSPSLLFVAYATRPIPSRDRMIQRLGCAIF